ncbi:hypothetical protein [Blastomonas sp.]|uniref:hypothetical protein n=1 Tax=Blastomonas sp. TaxID=1909299 RepID=UPI0035947028
MSIFHRAMDRFADFIWTGRKVNLRFTAEYRTACYAVPLINKLLAEGDDGDAYRTALVPWHEAERPPLAIYQGGTSRCRIDGPWQMARCDWLPLGGLILSPSVTAHLDPFEAQALHDKMQQAIETVILAWVRDHDLTALPPVPEHFDRRRADRKAKAMIAAWASGEGASATSIITPGDGVDCCSGYTADLPCDACRKGPAHD